MQETARIVALSTGLVILGAFYALSAYPQLIGAAQMDADAMCVPVKQECFCGMFKDSKDKCTIPGNKFMCPCFDITSGATAASGKCMANFKCLADQAGGMPPMLPMIPMMMPMPDMMMMQDPCMQQQGGGTTDTSTTTTASSTKSNPCDFGGGWNDWGGSIFDTSSYFNDSTSTDIINTKGGVSDFIVTATRTPEEPGKGTEFAATSTSRLSGNIKIGEAGAQIVANLKSGLTEVAGFFGGTTFNSLLSNSIAGRLCATRPWTGSVISKIIPTSFFDGLCKFTGFQVGVAVPAPTPVVNVPKRAAPPAKPPSLIPAVTGTPEADIWAEPPSVRLGTRTYIFWNAKGVLDCKVEGPNFFHNTLSGGASTVPLSGATTYTIECTAPGGAKIRDSVTVSLAI